MGKTIVAGIVFTLIIVVFIPTYWATEPGRKAAALTRQQSEAFERGAILYNSNCAVCHGSQGEGGIGSALKGTGLSNDALKKIIARGVPRTAMIAWSKEENGPFNREQINDLVTFIKGWDKGTTVTPSSAEPKTVLGKASADKLYAGSCAGCHGTNRQGIPGLGPALTPD